MVRNGGLAEYICAPAAELFVTPNGVELEVGASFFANYLTALLRKTVTATAAKKWASRLKTGRLSMGGSSLQYGNNAVAAGIAFDDTLHHSDKQSLFGLT